MGKKNIMKVLFVLTLSVVIFCVEQNPLMAFEKEVNEISISMVNSIAEAGKKTIAVVDFTDLQGNVRYVN